MSNSPTTCHQGNEQQRFKTGRPSFGVVGYGSRAGICRSNVTSIPYQVVNIHPCGRKRRDGTLDLPSYGVICMNRFFRGQRTFVVAIALGLAAIFTAGTNPAYADAGEADEIAAVSHAEISPAQAVLSAEQHSGGKAFGMGLEVTGHGTWYEVQLSVLGKPMLARVSPSTGAWLGMSPAKGEDAEGLHSLDGRKLDLSHAIAIAERAGHGRALEAGPYGKGASAHYDVDVVRADGGVAHLKVDADTGEVNDAPTSEAD